MAETLELKIVTPERELADETVEAVTAQGALGEFGVLPKHIDFVTALDPGPLRYTKGGVTRTLAVKGGYAEVHDDVMTVLADEAIPVEAIDPARAQADLDRAAAELAERPFGHAEHERARLEVRWAEVRVLLSATARAA